MNKYTPIHTHAQLVEALRRGLTVEINAKDNESAADYQAPPSSGWVGGLPAVTIAADDPNSYAWQGFAFRAVGEHDLSPAKPEPLTNADLSPAKPEPLTNADFNPGDIVRYRGKKWRVQGIDDDDSGCGLLLLDVAEPEDAPDFVDTSFPVTRGSNRHPGDECGYRWYWGGAKDVELVSRGEPGPAKPEPPALTNADLNPGDIVRCYDKEWRVQGIDDKDPSGGLLLLDVAEPEDAPDFVDTALPITRGSGRRPENGTGYRWRWGGAKDVELVSRGEPEAPDSEPAEGVGAVETSPAFLISVEIHADTPEGYAAAIETLARGIES